MEDKKILSSEEMEKVSGAGGNMSYHLKYLVCPSCGLQVGWDEFSPIGYNTYYIPIGGSTCAAENLYCNGCGNLVGSGYFAGEKDR